MMILKIKIFIKDKDSQPTELIQLVSNESQKILGVWLASDGNNDK